MRPGIEASPRVPVVIFGSQQVARSLVFSIIDNNASPPREGPFADAHFDVGILFQIFYPIGGVLVAGEQVHWFPSIPNQISIRWGLPVTRPTVVR